MDSSVHIVSLHHSELCERGRPTVPAVFSLLFAQTGGARVTSFPAFAAEGARQRPAVRSVMTPHPRVQACRKPQMLRGHGAIDAKIAFILV